MASNSASEKVTASPADSIHSQASAEIQHHPAEHPPESEISLRSILALAGSALAYFCTVGFLNAYGVFQQYYTAHYLPDYSNFQISWIGSFSTFMLFAIAAPAGLLADRFGPTTPIVIGSVLQIIAMFMVSLCREYYQFFLAQGVLLSVGMSLIALPTSTVVPQYFKRNRGLAQGVSIGGSSLGGILWPVALDQLLNHDQVDFGWSIRVVGFVMIPLLILVILCLRKPNSIKPTPTDAEHNTLQQDNPKPKKDWSVLKQPAYILLCIGLAIAYFGFFAPLYFVTVYATSLGFSENLAFYLVSILNGASLFGRILPGIIADRYGHFNVICLAAFGTAFVAFCWTKATSIAGLVIWTVAYGFVSGAILSSQLACAGVLTTEEMRGVGLGIAMASVSLTGLFGTPIAGQLVEHGFLALSLFSGATLVLGGMLLALARLSRDKGLWARV